MIIRDQYLSYLRDLQDQRVIKVITGVRRCGKSTLLALFRADLEKRGVKKSQIQFYNFEEQQPESLYDQRQLHDHILSKSVPDSMNYIFLDEIQKIEQFENCVTSLAAKENMDVYITGSNAFLLSGELATYLTGRYISIHLLPLSFQEYSSFFPDIHPRDLFDQYLYASSFPETLALAQNGPQYATKYLRDVYDTILERDIMAKYNIRDKSSFERVVRFVCNSIGSPISARSIANYFATEHISLSVNTILQYLDCLSRAYIIYPVSRYNIRGKHILSLNDKYYLVDLGLRDILLGETPFTDRGHRLENTVYLELLRRYGNSVYVGKPDTGEVDFVVEKPRGEREYYQVAYSIDSEDTLKRELLPLQQIKDNFPKTIITHDTITENFEGIQKINVVDWLLQAKD